MKGIFGLLLLANSVIRPNAQWASSLNYVLPLQMGVVSIAQTNRLDRSTQLQASLWIRTIAAGSAIQEGLFRLVCACPVTLPYVLLVNINVSALRC